MATYNVTRVVLTEKGEAVAPKQEEDINVDTTEEEEADVVKHILCNPVIWFSRSLKVYIRHQQRV